MLTYFISRLIIIIMIPTQNCGIHTLASRPNNVIRKILVIPNKQKNCSKTGSGTLLYVLILQVIQPEPSICMVIFPIWYQKVLHLQSNDVIPRNQSAPQRRILMSLSRIFKLIHGPSMKNLISMSLIKDQLF